LFTRTHTGPHHTTGTYVRTCVRHPPPTRQMMAVTLVRALRPAAATSASGRLFAFPASSASVSQMSSDAAHSQSPTKKAKMVATDAFPLSSALSSSPVKNLVPPGKCQLGTDFAPVPLLERLSVSSTTSLLRFGLPDSTAPMGLSTCACVLARASLPKTEGEDEKEDVIRPYTPISTNEQVGSFDLLVKHYDDGRMSNHLKSLPVGSTIDFKHIEFNVKIQYPFGKRKIGMLVGGTGVTPMIQALHAILGDTEVKGDQETTVSIIYGSRTADDILGGAMLDGWAEKYGDRLSVTHVLSHEPEGSGWEGERGYVSEDLVKRLLPGPEGGEDVLLFVCGPPPMYDALCGPRGEKEISGLLAKMGYEAGQVYKF